jgi:hypothetical protein
MTKQLHTRTLLIVAALWAACGEDAIDDYDDQTGDPANTGGWDTSTPVTPGGNTGGWSADAASSDAAPWGARSDAGSSGGGGSADAGSGGSWDAGANIDAGWSGGSDASVDAGPSDAGSDASVDAGRSDGGGADAAACTLTYANFGQQFLSTYCVGCHGATNPRANVRLDSLAGITARKTQAKAAVLTSIMPQGSNRPSQADRQRFGQWLDCGPN